MVTWWPLRASPMAAAGPAMPAPTMMMLRGAMVSVFVNGVVETRTFAEKRNRSSSILQMD